MTRKGILSVCAMLWALLAATPVTADETADDIAKMLTWWDEVGSDWEKAEAFIEFAGTEKTYQLADNTTEESDDESQQQ
ncbi:MAG: hypothetical protein RL122_2727 [Pseudomonadota bacterium]|uniref:Uncharacterized protein n=1 Tax=Thiothrix fructosivorans TaxID=111770 RepID=A0A8B0SHG6_9GAMM|nr:hypothetical protein [Thiothrix fructosivorans]MBO0613961.1 hypothetical protein [Thiothrix fructosivorans]QTX10325.1 hypothetical protein J1836_017340 [Thiothrix fructosivorans]